MFNFSEQAQNHFKEISDKWNEEVDKAILKQLQAIMDQRGCIVLNEWQLESEYSIDYDEQTHTMVMSGKVRLVPYIPEIIIKSEQRKVYAVIRESDILGNILILRICDSKEKAQEFIDTDDTHLMNQNDNIKIKEWILH